MADVDLFSAACMLPGLVTGTVSPSAGPLPAVNSALPPEPFTSYQPPTICSPTPKPGVVAFRAFVLSHLGGGDSGICRECNSGGVSEHHEGRAWDWRVSADVATDVARVDALLQWLLSAEQANFRRLGLMYLIWNGQTWSTKTQSWRPYTGKSPHRDHVHFSFGWDGANGKTSFFNWLSGGGPVAPGSELAASDWIGKALVASAGALAGYMAAGMLSA